MHHINTKREHRKAQRQQDARVAAIICHDGDARARRKAEQAHARAAQGIGKNTSHSWGTRSKKRAKIARRAGGRR